MTEIPKKLTEFSLFVEGVGYAGIVTSVTLPVLAKKKILHRGGGGLGQTAYTMGYEELTANFKLASIEREPFNLMGFRPEGSVGVEVRGSLQYYQELESVSAVMRGIITEINFGDWAVGEDTSLTFSMSLEYFSFSRGVNLLCEIDLKNGVDRWNGIDLREGVRKILLG